MPGEQASMPCDRHDQRLADHDLRLLTLETSAKVADSSIQSLKASSHEKANWLNRHNLEISELQFKVASVSQQFNALLAKVDKLDSDLTAMQLAIAAQIAEVRSDLRQTTWAVGLIVGLVVTVGRALATKFL